ncbi:unnamed protein product, partial [Owenia fusiformis]
YILLIAHYMIMGAGSSNSNSSSHSGNGSSSSSSDSSDSESPVVNTSLIKSTLTTTEKQQLSQHITELHNLAKLKHSQKDIDSHVQYIRTRVIQPILDKFNKMQPALAVDDVLLNGSMSNKSKIEFPNDIDFVLPMALSRYVVISEKGYRGWLHVKLPDAPHTDLLNLTKEHQELIPYGNSLNTEYLTKSIIHKTVAECLSQLHTEGVLIYKGEKDLKYKPVESSQLEENAVILHNEPHGPCIQLRVWGPLCVTDIDIAFCLKILNIPKLPHTEDNFFVALPMGFDWVKSFYEKPHLRASRIDDHHRIILKTLKYILSQYEKTLDVYDKTELHSHALFTIVRYHQEQCDNNAGEPSIAECYCDISHNLCKLLLESVENTTEVEVSARLLDDLFDKDCPDMYIYESGGDGIYMSIETILFLLVMYILSELLKSSRISSPEFYCEYLELVFRECKLECKRQDILQNPNRKLTPSEREEISNVEDMKELLKFYNDDDYSAVVNTERILSKLKPKIILLESLTCREWMHKPKEHYLTISPQHPKNEWQVPGSTKSGCVTLKSTVPQFPINIPRMNGKSLAHQRVDALPIRALPHSLPSTSQE